MGLTQKEIARNLGISYMTVNRALNNNGYVSKELREKILSYANEMGYEPHRASQVLVRNTTRNIALSPPLSLIISGKKWIREYVQLQHS